MAWVTLGALEALGDVAAADLVSRPTLTRDALDGRIRHVVAGEVADAIADSDVVEAAAVAAMSDAAVQAQLAYARGELAVHADNLRLQQHQGEYQVTTLYDQIALGLPEARAGALNVQWIRGTQSATSRAIQTYKPAETSHTWERRASSSGWTDWARIDQQRIRRLDGNEDLDDFRLEEHTGVWAIPNSDVAVALAGWPAEVGGNLWVEWIRGIDPATSYSRQIARPEGLPELRRELRGESGFTDWQEQRGGGGSVIDAPVTRVHLLMAAGQSNMSGRGTPYGAAFGDYLDGRIWEFTSLSSTLRPAEVPLGMHDAGHPSAGLSPASVFAREYVRNAPPGTVVLIIPAAHGGTGFDPAASPNWIAETGPDSLTEAMLTQTADAITAAQAEWPDATVEVSGFLWHQGEGTAGLADWQAYVAAFSTLVGRVRAVYPDVPVVLGELSPDRPSTAGSLAAYAHQVIPETLPRTALAHTPWNLSREGDLAHLGREGVEAVGKAMHEVFPAAVAAEDATLVMPPASVSAWLDDAEVLVEWSPPLCRVTAPYIVEASADGGATWSAADVTVLGRRATVTAPNVTHVRVASVGVGATSRFTHPVAV